eukprot:CAMPEP_0177766778 /NCGR_PEP_ID=MMETSP0491_2-20121128/8702_1 /TAXON_ID=63592 /ORGANISM="Tetraselmis chuii, Strain PLY429" /LENGTH=295 /DNA_ID=CAMNT_0019283207 /DNA_START=201 /DNA_END=1088 /DNA_ORIENTATION=+
MAAATGAAPAAEAGQGEKKGPPAKKVVADFSPKLRGWWRFTELYYLGNFLLLLSYVATRIYAVNVSRLRHSHILRSEWELLQWEQQAASLWGVVLLIKGWKALSLDMFLADAFLYGKAVLLALSYILDRRIFCYYMVFMVLLFLVAQQPCYSGPDKIKYFTPGTFKWEVQEEHKGVSWLVECYAPWSPPCIHLEPVFADLSLKYTTSKLKFGKLDLGRWPQAAPDLRIDVGGASEQLPTIIMFESGVEVGRIPHVFADGSFPKGKFRRSDIVKAFDLDSHYIRTVGKDSGDKKKK